MKPLVTFSLLVAVGSMLAPAVSAQNLFVVNFGNYGGNNMIGEYGLDGSMVTSWNSGVDNLGSIAVPRNDVFVSWGSYGDGYIAEYTTSGATVSGGLIYQGLENLRGIAISGDDVFVANGVSGTIGEYTTSGETVNASLISDLNGPTGIVISPVPESSVGVLVALGAAVLWLWHHRKQFGRSLA